MKAAWQEYQQIFGLDNIVEVDESELYRRKRNQGRLMVRAVGAYGGISRKTAEDLIPIMQDFVDQ